MTQSSHEVWKTLEDIRGLSAVPATWRAHLAGSFATFGAAFLQPETTTVLSVPCPRECGCWHYVIPQNDSFIGRCQCEPPNCADLQLTHTDVTALQLNRPKLARAIARAIGCDTKTSTIPLPNTQQIGSWSTEAVPVILTIQANEYDLRHVIAELGQRFQRPFILLAPTSDNIDAAGQELLAHTHAAFLGLDSTVRILQNGDLQPIKPPAELLARFLPESKRPRVSEPPRYMIRKGLGYWRLIFDGQEAILKHERGIYFVAWLLIHPPEHPIHAIDLIAKIPEMFREQLGLPPLVDPTTGKVAVLPSTARIQERSLALDDAQAMRALYRKEKELEDILDSGDASEPVKNEVLRELEQIAEFQKHNAHRTKDGAQRAVRAVRRTITRFHESLLTALDSSGNPHSVLRPFAQHVEKHILIPSSRYSGASHSGPRGPLSGCFTYEPPQGLVWAR